MYTSRRPRQVINSTTAIAWLQNYFQTRQPVPRTHSSRSSFDRRAQGGLLLQSTSLFLTLLSSPEWGGISSARGGCHGSFEQARRLTRAVRLVHRQLGNCKSFRRLGSFSVLLFLCLVTHPQVADQCWSSEAGTK